MKFIFARVAPFFTVSILQDGVLTKIGTSQVNDLVKKGDTSVCIRLAKPLSVSGDVLVEFYNKPKMIKKVRLR